MLGTAGIALAARTLWAPTKTPGLGMTGIALAVAVLGILYCLFRAAIRSTLNGDTL